MRYSNIFSADVQSALHHTSAYLRRRTSLANFRHGLSASAAVEFALLLPAFIALMLEIFQFGLYVYISSNLDGAITATQRQILTGIIGNQNLTANQFLTNVVCPQIGGSSCASSVIVNLMNVPATSGSTGYQSLMNSSGTDLINPTLNNASTSFCPGFSGGMNTSNGQAGVEVLEIFYPMPVFSPYWLTIASQVNGSSVYYVRAIATFQNEPYPVTSQTGGC